MITHLASLVDNCSINELNADNVDLIISDGDGGTLSVAA